VAAADRCSFKSGDIFSGAYRRTVIVPLLSNTEVSFTFGPDSQVIETNGLGSTWSRWVSAGPNVVIQEFAQTSNDVNVHAPTCPSSSIAKYELDWSVDCREVTLEAVHDECQSRAALLTTVTLRKEEVVTPVGSCTLLPGSHWTGIYPERTQRTELSGQRVQITVAPKGVMLEKFVKGAIFSSHTMDNNAIVMRDVASQPADLACTSSAVGRYTLIFSADCEEVVVREVSGTEQCAGRSSRLDGLQLVKLDAELAGSLLDRASGSYMTGTAYSGTTHSTTHSATMAPSTAAATTTMIV